MINLAAGSAPNARLKASMAASEFAGAAAGRSLEHGEHAKNASAPNTINFSFGTRHHRMRNNFDRATAGNGTDGVSGELARDPNLVDKFGPTPPVIWHFGQFPRPITDAPLLRNQAPPKQRQCVRHERSVDVKDKGAGPNATSVVKGEICGPGILAEISPEVDAGSFQSTFGAGQVAEACRLAKAGRRAQAAHYDNRLLRANMAWRQGCNETRQTQDQPSTPREAPRKPFSNATV